MTMNKKFRLRDDTNVGKQQLDRCLRLCRRLFITEHELDQHKYFCENIKAFINDMVVDFIRRFDIKDTLTVNQKDSLKRCILDDKKYNKIADAADDTASALFMTDFKKRTYSRLYDDIIELNRLCDEYTDDSKSVNLRYTVAGEHDFNFNVYDIERYCVFTLFTDDECFGLLITFNKNYQ